MTRERIVAGMAGYLWATAWADFGDGGPVPAPPPAKAFQHAEIITREIEKRNRSPVCQILSDSIALDLAGGLTPPLQSCTPEHFGRSLASMYLGVEDPIWWDDHLDFDLLIPYIPGLDLEDVVAVHRLKEAV